jgi:8-oxo-dGTP pyrophosphatase MutT (NUDIX family)
MSTEDREPEFSAGGVVVRGDDVIVIVPAKRGETSAEAAAREVREEAGVTGDLLESLGTVEYTYERKRRSVAKRVEFFLIEYREGDPADHDHEVEEARWMPLADAATALTYAGEREIVARAMSRRSSDR